MITIDGIRTTILWTAIVVWILAVAYYAKAAPFWKSLEGIHIFLEMVFIEIVLLYVGLRIGAVIKHNAAAVVGSCIYGGFFLLGAWRLFLMIRANRPDKTPPDFNVISKYREEQNGG